MSESKDRQLRVREATEADLPAIVRLLADDALGATREQLGSDLDPAYARAFAEMQAQRGCHFLGAEIEGELVGCMQLVIIPGLSHRGARRAQIESVRIARSWRGQGLGAQLTEAALDIAREHDCLLAQLTTHRQRTDAHRFYQRMGFEFTHLGMKKRLGPRKAEG